MKSIKLLLLVFTISIFGNNLFAQIKATTADGDKVEFNSKSNLWEFEDKEKAKTSRGTVNFDVETFKSFTTSKGEISLAELKSIYLSDTLDKEVIEMVDQIYESSSKCDCTVCNWPSHCTWGSSCQYARRIPCSWCCK